MTARTKAYACNILLRYCFAFLLRVRVFLFPSLQAALLLCVLISNPEAQTTLDLKSVYPTLAEAGKNVDVTLRGTGFDERTRVSMYLDLRNEWRIAGSKNDSNSAQGEPVFGKAGDIAVSGSVAYVVTEWNGLHLVNISNPSNPRIMSTVKDGPLHLQLASAVAVSKNHAYVTDRSGLTVINISDPLHPFTVGQASTTRGARDIALSGDYAYLIDGENVLQLCNITNPEQPCAGGTVAVPEITDADAVAVRGDYVYIIGQSGLSIVNISDPAGPGSPVTVQTDGEGYGLAVSGNHAFIADGSKGLAIINISNPLAPLPASNIKIPGTALDIAVSENRAYVSCGPEGIYVIDIGNISAPEIIGFVNTPGSSQSVTVSGDYAYVADDTGGLQIIDINNPANRHSEISLDTPGNIEDVTASGNYIYAADGDKGLQIINIANPESPVIEGNVHLAGYAQGVTTTGNYAYVASGDSGLHLIDLEAPQDTPIVVDTVGKAEEVAVSGNHAYVAAGAAGLKIFDVSDTSSPLRIDVTLPVPGYAEGVSVSDNYAFVAYGLTGIQVIDISNPANSEPDAVLIDTPGYARSVVALGSYVFIADDSGGLQIFRIVDISDPDTPQIESASVDTPGDAYGVAISGSYVYVADDRAGLVVMNIENPLKPFSIGYIDTQGYANAVAVSGDYVFAADSFSGLVVVPKPLEISPVTLIDNTSMSLTVPGPPAAGHYTLRVFNDSENRELPGAVTFESNAFVEEMAHSKAIIIAGYGPSDPGRGIFNTIWEETQMLANFAYRVLLYQGYTHENIYYLSPVSVDADGDGAEDVDGNASLSDLSYAVNAWTKGPDSPARNLLIYMVDHGGLGTYGIKHDEILNVELLDFWLDRLQSAMEGKLIFIYEACNSGSFIHLGEINTDGFRPMMVPPAGKERIIITSSQWNQRSVFQENGKLTFSYNFLSALYDGNYMTEAFQRGNAAVWAIPQAPGLDSNGDGRENSPDDNIDGLFIGRGYRPDSRLPSISHVSPDQTLNGEDSALIWADGIFNINGISEVWATIVPPGNDGESSSIPLTDLPKLPLDDPDGDGRYEGAYNVLDAEGVYSISVYAMDSKGMISLPANTSIYQMTGQPDPDPQQPDIYEEDNSHYQARIINLNDPDPQKHNFYEEGDEDWVKFYGIRNERYTVRAGNPGKNADVIIELYYSDGTTLLQSVDAGGLQAKEELYITWDWNNCTACGDGVYYIRVRSNGPSGTNTSYNLQVYHSYAWGLPVTLTGVVSDISTGNAVETGIIIDKYSTLSDGASGVYALTTFLTPGTYAINEESSEYDFSSPAIVTINAEDRIISKNLTMIKKCTVWEEICDGQDNDCDGQIDENVCDDDGDGYPNELEISSGSDPDNRESRPVNISIMLKKGLNIFGYPVTEPWGLTSFQLLASLGNSSEIESISIYDNSAGKYRTAYYNGPDTAGSDIPVAFSDGILVNAKISKNIIFNVSSRPSSFVNCIPVDFTAGLNVATLPCAPSGYSSYQLLSDLGGSAFAHSVQRLNTDTGLVETASFYNGAITGADFGIRAGEGYFIFMNKDRSGFLP